MTHPMAGATREFPEEVIARHREGIRVLKKQDRHLVGSCNACTTINILPTAYDMVTEVHLRAMSIRLCPTCRDVLKKAL